MSSSIVSKYFVDSGLRDYCLDVVVVGLLPERQSARFRDSEMGFRDRAAQASRCESDEPFHLPDTSNLEVAVSWDEKVCCPQLIDQWDWRLASMVQARRSVARSHLALVAQGNPRGHSDRSLPRTCACLGCALREDQVAYAGQPQQRTERRGPDERSRDGEQQEPNAQGGQPVAPAFRVMALHQQVHEEGFGVRSRLWGKYGMVTAEQSGATGNVRDRAKRRRYPREYYVA